MSSRGKKISPSDVKEILERAGRNLREKEAERKKAGLRRPEEPGLTPEARHFTINF